MTPRLLSHFILFILFPSAVFSQALQWAGKVGGNSSDIGNRSAVDANGNLYLTGNFQGSNVDFDPGPGTFLLSSAGSKDGFVAKYNKDGIFKWAFKIGGSNIDAVEDVVVNHAGDLIISGFFRGPNVDFNPSAATNALSSNGEAGGDPGYGGDVFVAKYDTLGNYKWAFNVGGAFLGDNATCLTVDNNDNIIASGYFTDVVDFDPSPASTILTWTGGTVFIAKYTTNGAFQWAFNFGAGTTDNSSFSVTTDNANNIITTGFFQGSGIDFDPGAGTNTLSSAGFIDFFIAKYTPGGQYFWAKRAGGAGADVGRAVVVDAANDIYVTGDYTSTTINFNGGSAPNTIGNNGLNDLFLTKYSAAGQHQWSFGVGGNDYEIGTAMAIDEESNLLITGTFSGVNVDFDPSLNTISLSTAGGNDVFAVKYSPAGNYLCGFRVGGPNNDVGRGLNTFGQYFYLAGQFNGSAINFAPVGTPVALSSVSDDAFLTKYDWTLVPPAGTISGTSNCLTGISQLTFTATAGVAPFNLYISNGSSTSVYNNIQSGIPFTLLPSPSAPTTYTLTGIRDAQRCGALAPANSAVVLSPTSLPIITSGNTGICRTDSAQLSATGGVVYQWLPVTGLSNPAIANPKASPLATTTYKVTVTNSTGCKDSASLTVTLNPSPVISINPASAAFCPGDSVQLSASGGTVYSWTPAVGLNNAGIANPKAAPHITTTYKVIVTNSDGCRDSMNKVVIRKNSPVAGISAAAAICPADSAQLTATGGVLYQWSPVVGLSNPSSSSPKASPAITTVYKAVVTNNDGCAESATTTVTVNTKPTVLVNGSTAVCAADSAQLFASGGVVYSWVPVAGLNNPSLANPKASPPATTLFKVIVSGANGCRDSATTTVTVNQKPVVQVSPSGSVCEGDSIQLTASGGVGYIWSPSAGLSSSSVSAPKASPQATTVYNVVVTNSGGCVDSGTVTISFKPKPLISTNLPTSVCRGDTAQLSASGGTTYLWSPATGLSESTISNPMAYPTATTTYKIIVTDAEACRDSVSRTLAVTPPAVVTLGADTTICGGETVLVDAGFPGGTNYTWSNGATTSAITVTEAGTYSVTANLTGCVAPASDTIVVSSLLLPTVKLRPDTAICDFSSLLLTASGTDVKTWVWNTGSPDSFLLVNRAGTYTITAGNKCGTAVSVVEIGNISCADDLFFPTAFTPNADGRNDVFKAGYLNGVKVYDFELSVYNRWGQKVFSTTDVTKGWKGIFNTQPQPTGVFVFMAGYRKSPTGIRRIKKGTVALIR